MSRHPDSARATALIQAPPAPSGGTDCDPGRTRIQPRATGCDPGPTRIHDPATAPDLSQSAPRALSRVAVSGAGPNPAQTDPLEGGHGLGPDTAPRDRRRRGGAWRIDVRPGGHRRAGARRARRPRDGSRAFSGPIGPSRGGSDPILLTDPVVGGRSHSDCGRCHGAMRAEMRRNDHADMSLFVQKSCHIGCLWAFRARGWISFAIAIRLPHVVTHVLNYGKPYYGDLA